LAADNRGNFLDVIDVGALPDEPSTADLTAGSETALLASPPPLASLFALEAIDLPSESRSLALEAAAVAPNLSLVPENMFVTSMLRSRSSTANDLCIPIWGCAAITFSLSELVQG